jgi:FkbM family methyltransferase
LFNEAPLDFAPSVRMRLLPGDVISDSIAFTGIYDLPLTRTLLGLAREGGRLVDVGANLGYFSLLWAAAREGNSVVAFEASPRNVALLRHNVETNHLARRIEVRAQAVGKASGEMDFDLGPEEQTGWGGLKLTSSERTQKVQVVRLDDVLGDEPIDLLKIDIEGADTWALMGAERLLRERRIKHLWWEQNKPRMRELNINETEAARFIKSVGYQPMPQGDPRGESVNWHATWR